MLTPARRISPLVLVALLLAIALVLPSTVRSQADTFTAALTADLTAATTVFQGTVHTSRPSKNATTGVISTTLVVQPTVTLKGSRVTSDRSITVEGGVVAGETMRCSHCPEPLTNGDRVIVLLDGSGALMPGRAVYKLGESDTVDDMPLTLADVRSILGH